MNNNGIIKLNGTKRFALLTTMVLSFGILTMANSNSAIAQQFSNESASSDAEANNPRPWLISCTNIADESKITCNMQQNLTTSKGKRRVVTASIEKTLGNRTVSAVFLVPLGLYIPDGVNIQVDDGAKQNIPVITCDSNGCLARKVISSRFISALKRGETLNLMLKANNNKKELKFPITLRDFSKTYNKLP